MKKQRIITWLVIILVLSGLYFFTRLVSIRSLPPFNDEFIYVRWAQLGFFDPATRLWSLSDGKQPLYIWLTSVAMTIIPSPLAAGRIVSVLSGFAAMAGLAVLSWKLLKNRFVTMLTSVLYILSPFALVLDRFALYDSLLAALSIWSMVVMYQLTQRPTLGTSLVLALLLGAALLTKSSAVLLILMLLLGIAFLAKKKQKFTVLLYFTIAVAVAFLYQSVEHLYPGNLVVTTKNSVFVYTIRELRTTPIIPLVLRNFSEYFGWIVFYFTPPLLIACGGALLFDKNNRKNYVYLLATFLVPFTIVLAVGKLLYARHLFFFFTPLLILAASGVIHAVRRLHNSLFRIAIVAFCLLPVSAMTTQTIFNFKNATLPVIDKFQYVDGWPAGWGIKDIVRYLEIESQKGDITILTEGVFGSMPTTAMLLYFGNYPQVHIIPIDDTKPLAIPSDLDWRHPVYFILNKQQEIPESWNAEEVLKIQKGKGNSYIRLLKFSGR